MKGSAVCMILLAFQDNQFLVLQEIDKRLTSFPWLLLLSRTPVEIGFYSS